MTATDNGAGPLPTGSLINEHKQGRSGRFEQLFCPKVVALVGATNRSRWSEQVHTNLTRVSSGVKAYCVNPNGGNVHGVSAVTSLSAIGADVDLVYVMSPRDTVPAVLREAADVGAHAAIVLTAGFAETADGVELEAQLATAAADAGVRLLGPNVSGFLNVADGIYPFGLALPDIPLPGPSSYVMQSGGLVKPILALAKSWGCGVGVVACTGNETQTTVVDAVDIILDDERTRAIGLFLETVRDPEGLRRVSARALEQDVAIVALTVGHSEVSQRTAQAHTGALAGDAAVRSAALRALNIIEVTSMEELVVTTDLLARGIRPRGARVGVIGASGGACSVIADTGARSGLNIPDFTRQCADVLEGLLPGISHAQNPLDVTGVATTDRALPIRALEAVLAHDGGNLDAILFEAFVLPSAGAVPVASADFYRQLGSVVNQASIPVLLLDEVASSVPHDARELLETCGLTRLPGTALGVQAFAHAVAWTAGRDRPNRLLEGSAPPLQSPHPDAGRALSEYEALQLLGSAGVPVVPSRLATTAAEAVAHAADLGGRVALKVCSADVMHKSDVGGVRLDLHGESQISEAFESILETVAAALPQAALDGVLVTPMRSEGGVELIVGVHRDAVWGPTLMVGLGGVLVEVLRDVSLRPMPVTRTDVATMLDELRGSALLGSVRGRPAVDRAALIDAVLAIAAAAHALGDSLDSLEVNPIRAAHDRAEALDALVVWASTTTPSTRHGGRS